MSFCNYCVSNICNNMCARHSILFYSNVLLWLVPQAIVSKPGGFVVLLYTLLAYEFTRQLVSELRVNQPRLLRLGLARTSGFFAAAAAPMKRSVLNVRFKTERFIRAAAAAVSPLRQKTARARKAFRNENAGQAAASALVL